MLPLLQGECSIASMPGAQQWRRSMADPIGRLILSKTTVLIWLNQAVIVQRRFRQPLGRRCQPRHRAASSIPNAGKAAVARKCSGRLISSRPVTTKCGSLSVMVGRARATPAIASLMSLLREMFWRIWMTSICQASLAIRSVPCSATPSL